MTYRYVDNYIKLTFEYNEEYFFFDSRVPADARAAYDTAMKVKASYDAKSPLKGDKTYTELKVSKGHRSHISVWVRSSGLPATLPEVGEYVPYVPTHEPEGAPVAH
jgi:hypothetical protein